MKLDERHYYEKVVTIGVEELGDTKRINVSLDGTVLHLDLNKAQAEMLSEELRG